jgi:hypothetical protein
LNVIDPPASVVTPVKCAVSHTESPRVIDGEGVVENVGVAVPTFVKVQVTVSPTAISKSLAGNVVEPSVQLEDERTQGVGSGVSSETV